MNRRTFLALSGATTGALSLGSLPSTAADGAGRQYLELRKYTFASADQRSAFHKFLKDVGVPAFNRHGLRPVGVFQDPKEAAPVYLLLPHPTAESALTLRAKLLADADFTGKGAVIVDAPKSALPFQEEESWLLLAFKGMPKVETPVTSPDRLFNLRIYESPSLKTGDKKIEMFNDAGELKIFREVGLLPVFFGETLFGAKQPNLTYMLGFESDEARKAAWGKFGQHPEWQKLRAMAEYADSRVIRGITDVPLKPTDYSQI